MCAGGGVAAVEGRHGARCITVTALLFLFVCICLSMVREVYGGGAVPAAFLVRGLRDGTGMQVGTSLHSELPDSLEGTFMHVKEMWQDAPQYSKEGKRGTKSKDPAMIHRAKYGDDPPMWRLGTSKQ